MLRHLRLDLGSLFSNFPSQVSLLPIRQLSRFLQSHTRFSIPLPIRSFPEPRPGSRVLSSRATGAYDRSVRVRVEELPEEAAERFRLGLGVSSNQKVVGQDLGVADHRIVRHISPLDLTSELVTEFPIPPPPRGG